MKCLIIIIQKLHMTQSATSLPSIKYLNFQIIVIHKFSMYKPYNKLLLKTVK